MKMAYADPPYLGCCGLYGHEHGASGLCWDDPETHAGLLLRLQWEYPEGWAMSMSAASLPQLARFIPEHSRVAAWVKPFASFKPNVNPAYAWEPVVWCSSAKRERSEPTVRDWCAVSITLKRGFTGAKPEGFCRWLFNLLGLRPSDEFVDLYPGSGAVSRAWGTYRNQLELTA